MRFLFMFSVYFSPFGYAAFSFLFISSLLKEFSLSLNHWRQKLPGHGASSSFYSFRQVERGPRGDQSDSFFFPLRFSSPIPPGAKGSMAVTGDSSELEWAIQTLVKNYDKYSGKGCCCRRRRGISKSDFRKMLSHELNHMLTDTKNRQAADKLICDLDENQDGEINFDEYWNLIGGIASPISCLIRQQEESEKFKK
ncbi:protein S100-A16 [Pseudonaja textilis]|nr:protein S100-A16 [Pseudonaja textilis]